MSARDRAMPTFIEPARARPAAVPPSEPGWVHEIKLDGYRMQARIEGGRVALLTRRGLDWTDRFLGLVPAFARLPLVSAIIDGEAIVEDARGVSDFALLQAELGVPRSPRIVCFAFDLLWLDGESWLERPLAERKGRLEGLLAGSDRNLRYAQHIAGDGPVVLAGAARLGVEGLVSKHLDGRYRPGRDDWRKCKLTLRDELAVVGYTEASSPKESVGALVLGYWHEGRLVHAGRVGTGFSRRLAADLWQALGTTRTAGPPVAARPEDRDVHWVTPLLAVEVEYSGWTADGLLRHARLKGLREDKTARDVGRPSSL